jgi:hypothetical protein
MTTTAQAGVANVAQTGNLEPHQIGSLIGSVPFGQLILSTAMGIADAQAALDRNSVRVAEMMSGRAVLRDPDSMLPLDERGLPPPRIGPDGSLFANIDPANTTPFRPLMMDTRVYFGRNVDGSGILCSMIELGFTPTFYHFVETVIEIKISITMTKSMEGTDASRGNIVNTVDRSVTHSSASYSSSWWGGRRATVNTTRLNDITTTVTPVDAAYSAKFGYSIEASAFVRTKLVPIPPPPILEQRVRALMDVENAILARQKADLAQTTARAAFQTWLNAKTDANWTAATTAAGAAGVVIDRSMTSFPTS